MASLRAHRCAHRAEHMPQHTRSGKQGRAALRSGTQKDRGHLLGGWETSVQAEGNVCCERAGGTQEVQERYLRGGEAGVDAGADDGACGRAREVRAAGREDAEVLQCRGDAHEIREHEAARAEAEAEAARVRAPPVRGCAGCTHAKRRARSQPLPRAGPGNVRQVACTRHRTCVYDTRGG